MTTSNKLDIRCLNEDIFGKIIKYVHPFKPSKCYKNDIHGNILTEYIYVNNVGSLKDLIITNKDIWEIIKPTINSMAREYYITHAFQCIYDNYKYYVECKKEETTLKKMIKKLKNNNVEIDNKLYQRMNTRSLYHFMKSIYWGESYNLDDRWMDILALWRINIEDPDWNQDSDEMDMVRIFEDDFKHNWLKGMYYDGHTNTILHDSMLQDTM